MIFDIVNYRWGATKIAIYTTTKYSLCFRRVGYYRSVFHIKFNLSDVQLTLVFVPLFIAFILE